jgi:hypothetical protein
MPAPDNTSATAPTTIDTVHLVIMRSSPSEPTTVRQCTRCHPTVAGTAAVRVVLAAGCSSHRYRCNRRARLCNDEVVHVEQLSVKVPSQLVGFVYDLLVARGMALALRGTHGAERHHITVRHG